MANIMSNIMFMSLNMSVIMNLNMISKPINENMMKLQLLKNNFVNIYYCFDYNQREANFVGENLIYCDICNKLSPTTYETYLYSTPNIIILILNRGISDEFKVKMEFYTEIDLNNYVSFYL